MSSASASPSDTSASGPVILWGAPVGLYTGKVRSYLRKQGIAYEERLPSDPEFQRQVMPAVQRFINPVVRLPDGQLVQDTTDLIDHFEHSGQARFSVYPRGPLQRVVALAMDLLGGEGLVRAAMHFRWSYRTQNEAFLRHEFGLSFRAAGLPQAAIDQQLDGFMGYLNAYLPKLGITTQSTAAVEASYYALLTALDAHFRVHPYVLGGMPTVADFGFIANLYAHLGRDPYPSMQMKLQAPSVYRFTERMMASDADAPEFPHSRAALPEDDTVPETLGAVARCMAQDFLPELRAIVHSLDAWLAQQGEIAPLAPVSAKPSIRMLTSAEFSLRGTAMQSMAGPYTLYMLQRVTDAYAALGGDDQLRVHAWFSAHGLQELLTLRASRRVARRNHIEVWE